MEQASHQARLAEELTDEEVRDLLERLSENELGGSAKATVGAVMEATGTDLETVGRLLAEIRKEDAPVLEEQKPPIAPPVLIPRPGAAIRELDIDEYRRQNQDRLAEQERRKDDRERTGRIFVGTLAASLIVALGVICPKVPTSAPSLQAKPLQELHMDNGAIIYDNPRGGGVFVKEPTGRVREATEAETAEWASQVIAQSKK